MKPTIRLLYAEDNPQDADLTRTHFAEYAPEFELMVVDTGAACLELVRSSPPDVLLLDHHLPDIDSPAMLKTLHREAPGLPVVLVTGVGNEELVVRALRLGAANYVRKHGNYLEALPNLLRTVLDEHRRQQSTGLATAPQRILYVEHQAMDIDLTLRHFADAAPQFTVEVIQSCAEALARLALPPVYDLALIDLRMPDQSGLDLVRDAQRRKLSLPPFIMISGSGDEETAIAALKLGAADYIVKHEGYLNQLIYRIDHAIDHERLNRLNEALRADVAERKQVEENLRVHQIELETQNHELLQIQEDLSAAQARYFDLYDFAPVGYCTVNAKGLILQANLAASTLLGVDRGGLVKQSFYEFILREDRDSYYLLCKQVVEDNSSQARELRMVRRGRSDTPFWVALVAAVQNGDGVPVFRIVLTDITGLKQAEAVLRKSEELNRNIIHTAMDGYWRFDIQGRLLEVNEAYCRMSGYSQEELLTMRVADLEAVETPEEIAAHMRYVMAQGHDRFESRHRSKDGNLFDVAISINYLPRLDSQFVVFIQDITKRKQTELALRDSEALGLAILDSVTAEIAVLDADGVIVLVNQPWRRFALENGSESGIPAPQTEVGVNYLAVCRASSVSASDVILLGICEGIQGVLDGRLPSFTIEYPCDSPQQQRWFSMIVTPLGGHGKGAVVSHVDITERKQAEQKLQLAASVFTHAREGIMITAADGTIIDVNDAFSDITSYSHDEVIGRNPRLLRSGRHERQFYSDLWQNLLEKGHWYGEIWNRRKDGEVYAVMQTISAVRDAEGNPRYYLSLFSDITLIKEREQALEHSAHYDTLTSLPNRALLADRLQQGIAQARRRGNLLGVAFLDLDGFKIINDQYGHEAGDQLLIAVAANMKQTLREGDTLARMGGDEFVAELLDLVDVEASAPMLVRLLAAAAEPMQYGDLSLQVSASLGVTFYPQAENIDADQLLRQADQAMYQAKQAGKNRYHIFDAVQDSRVRGRYESLEFIRHALATGEFVLYYQPYVDMRKGAIIGAEALIRWQHPAKGLLSPATFLPVIEDHPLAVELGEWVIETALAQIEIWLATGLNIPVSVNVGARQLQQTDFVERLRGLLAAHPGVSPSCLKLEVLETSALINVARVSQVIETCRGMGVMFAMDDFGTGYSSLTYLKQLPVATIKIDQSFVRGMLYDPDDLAILKGVLSLSGAFHREVVAEGVETIEQGAMLLQLGCDLAQGYCIAHPMPARELPDWLVNWRPDPSWAGSMPLSQAVG
ncbi:MAG: EAL domain-containing protein [Methylococcaceae bacterium]